MLASSVISTLYRKEQSVFNVWRTDTRMESI